MLPSKPISDELINEITALRRHLHANPELGFEERYTASIVVERLQAAGIEVHQGLAGTGVVGVLKRGDGLSSLGIRADMDALPMQEDNDCLHRSQHANKMHACGHDGHTAMLLGAAKHLAEHGQFNGTVYFIFQPAEENQGGGRMMVEEGLFERFDIDEVYALHNWPGKPLGEVYINDGAMMASFDIFDIELQGAGTHAAMPELGSDPIIAGAHLVTYIQSIVSRMTSPLSPAVLSITQFHSGDTYNIIPQSAKLSGTVRAFDENIRYQIQTKLTEAVQSLPKLYGVTGKIDYQVCYPATINNAQCAQKARTAAAIALGKDKIFSQTLPTMASEDFSFMLNAKQGAYIWLGVDESKRISAPLHNPKYDFNDNALKSGIALWVSLVEYTLGK